VFSVQGRELFPALLLFPVGAWAENGISKLLIPLPIISSNLPGPLPADAGLPKSEIGIETQPQCSVRSADWQLLCRGLVIRRGIFQEHAYIFQSVIAPSQESSIGGHFSSASQKVQNDRREQACQNSP